MIFGLALGAATLAGAGNAATVSFSGSSNSGSFSLSKFDTALGTLTSAIFSVKGTATATQTSSTAMLSVATALAALEVSFAGLVFSSQKSEESSCVTDHIDSLCTVIATATTMIDDSGLVSDLNRLLVSGAGSETVFASISETGTVSATVTYYYTPSSTPAPVPLPAAGVLLLAGLGGLGLMRRKRAA